MPCDPSVAKVAATSATRRRRSTLSIFAGLVLVLIAGVGFAVSVGSVALSPLQVWHSLTGTGTPLQTALIWDLRMPRALSGVAVGGLLALAGALMQVLLRNPLADPYVLGVSGGASVGALGAMLLGLSAWWISTAAFAVALVSMALVFGLSRGPGGWTPARLLLTGVVIAAGWGATISFLLAIGPDQGLRGMLFWLMGDLSGATMPTAQLVILLLGCAISFPIARSLNLLALGEPQAGALGVAVAPLRLAVYVLASLLTASAVTLAGSIGFIGLVVPHILRLTLGSDHRRLLPASVLFGSALLVVADTLARSVAAPNQLPVGVLTAFLGVPTFLYLLHRSR